MSELISHFKLTTYPIIALAIFLAVFAVVCWRTLRPSQRTEMDRHASIPLNDD